VLDAHRDRAAEQLLDHVGGCRGAQVEIVVREAEEIVPNRPTDAPGLEAGIL
jgi:hypothetical protein